MLDLYENLSEVELERLKTYFREAKESKLFEDLEDSVIGRTEFNNFLFNHEEGLWKDGYSLSVKVDKHVGARNWFFGVRDEGFYSVGVLVDKEGQVIRSYLSGDGVRVSTLDFPFEKFGLVCPITVAEVKEELERLKLGLGKETLKALMSYSGEPDWVKHLPYVESLVFKEAYRLGML